MKPYQVLPVLFLLASAGGCGEEQTEENGEDSPETVVETVVELPGVILSPTGDTVTAGTGESVLLYYWVPLNLYDEARDDLLFLASLDSTIIPLPIQPDHDSRNHAQRVVNNLDIPLPVYLADSSVMEQVDFSILPFSMLLTPGSPPAEGSGFGSPERLLDTASRTE